MLPLLLLLLLPISCAAFDQESLDLFDLVEEVQKAAKKTESSGSFYDLLDTTQDATPAEIRKAYRTKSLQLHPDKNPDDPDASEKFRLVAAVAEVLKGEESRQKYDLVLKNGLPDWKTGVFFYRYAAKTSLTEVLLMILGVISVVQYVVAWTSYADARATERRRHEREAKKLRKERKSNQNAEPPAPASDVPRPSLQNLLIIQAPLFLIKLVINSPQHCRDVADFVHRKRNPPPEPEQAEAPERAKREVVVLEAKTAEIDFVPVAPATVAPKVVEVAKRIKKGPWSAAEIQVLSKATSKYPGGYPNRWQVIADECKREVKDVIAAAQKHGMGSSTIAKPPKPTTAQSSHKKPTPAPTPAPAPAPATAAPASVPPPLAATSGAGVWTASQQQQLEAAIKAIPKTEGQRWDLISDAVTGKSKVECVARYKELAALAKARKEAQ